MSDLQASLPPRVPPPQPDRFNDSEVLFTTLMLMLGEPPIPPILHATEGARFKYAHDMKQYGFEIKLWMSEYGHNPHIGLFTEYMHWCKSQWDFAKCMHLTTVVKEQDNAL